MSPWNTPCPDQSHTPGGGHCLWRCQALGFLPHHPPSHMRWSWQNYEESTVCFHSLPTCQEPNSLRASLLITVSERGIPSGSVHLAQEFILHGVLTSLPISRSYTFHLTTHVTWIRFPSGQASVWQFGDVPQVNPTLILPSRWWHQVEEVSREHQ